MTKHAQEESSASALMGSQVSDAQGRAFGQIRELAVAPAIDSSRVHGFVIRRTGAGRGQVATLVTIADLERRESGEMRLREGARPEPLAEDDSFLLLERDLLDQQIIDVNGHKVVRVNDVDLVWEPVARKAVRDADARCRCASRRSRLGRGCGAAAAERTACEHGRPGLGAVPDERDSVGFCRSDRARSVAAVKLKIEQDRLAKMHPSDIADILEDLAPAERQALFSQLDEEVAAEALEEIEPRMQQSLTGVDGLGAGCGNCGGDGPGGCGGLSVGAAG